MMRPYRHALHFGIPDAANHGEPSVNPRAMAASPRDIIPPQAFTLVPDKKAGVGDLTFQDGSKADVVFGVASGDKDRMQSLSIHFTSGPHAGSTVSISRPSDGSDSTLTISGDGKMSSQEIAGLGAAILQSPEAAEIAARGLFDLKQLSKSAAQFAHFIKREFGATAGQHKHSEARAGNKFHHAAALR